MSVVSLSVTPGGAFPSLPLNGISEDYINCASTVGLTFHILQCGSDEENQKPLILLLHGFPELAFSWRKVMPAIASAGFHVVAMDQRGYGRTTGWADRSYHDTDLRKYTLLGFASDAIALVYALGYDKVQCVVGHDAGSAIAAYCAVIRPDLFKSCVLMSHPFKGIPTPPNARGPSKHAATEPLEIERDPNIQTSLSRLQPPRKHYKWYNSTPAAAEDWSNPQQGLSSFLRGYFHLKSANCLANNPHPLKSWTAGELAKMPHYYVMPIECSMPEAVAMDMFHEEKPESTQSWLPDHDLDVYVDEWSRTGFQAALNFYRVATNPSVSLQEMVAFAGRSITVPCAFVSGDKDWGNYQDPGALESMQHACTDFRGIKLVRGAGHWPQQEQPGQVVAEILLFVWQVQDPRLRTPRVAPQSPLALQKSAAPPEHDRNPPLRSAPIRVGYSQSMTSISSMRRSRDADTPIVGPSRSQVFSGRLRDQNSGESGWVSDTGFTESNMGPYSAGMESHFPPMTSQPRVQSTTEQPSSDHTAVEGSTEPPQRQDTPIVGPRTHWDDAPFFRSSHRRQLSASTRNQMIAASSAARNDDAHRDLMEKIQLDLNRTTTPFEMTHDDDQGSA